MNAKKAWHFRVRRWAARGHAWVDVILAAILALMVNVLAIRHPLRVDITRARHFSLTPETRRLLARLPGEVRLTVFLGADHELAREVRQLLREYEHAAPRLRVEFVDPHRDLARSKELALQYDVREPNVLVLEAGSRTRLLPAAELAEAGAAPGAGRRFRGEQVLSNALRNLAQPRKAVVYFLTGHGERRLDDFDPYAGYSILARTLEKRHMEVKALAFSGLGAVPADADLLVMLFNYNKTSRSVRLPDFTLREQADLAGDNTARAGATPWGRRLRSSAPGVGASAWSLGSSPRKLGLGAVLTIVEFRRAGGNRTPNRRFWRPVLCQLSYCPRGTLLLGLPL